MVEHILALFPKLRPGSFLVTSRPDPMYNCIAWAAGVDDDWWWPLDDRDEAYWPEAVPRVRTLDAFRATFATLGYAACERVEMEAGFEKIAIFVDAFTTPTHAARQLATGRWTSKLGKGEDIEHHLHDLEGDVYGFVVVVMKRPLALTPPPKV